jgi:hypothetical protein
MALSNTERQRLSREKAALRGSKSLSIGTIPIKYHKRFKELATLAKEGKKKIYTKTRQGSRVN